MDSAGLTLGPSYQPAADAPDEKPGPVFDDNNPPTWTDLVKAAHRAQDLKDLQALTDARRAALGPTTRA